MTEATMTEAAGYSGAVVVTPAQRRFASWMADVLVRLVQAVYERLGRAPA